jgi:sulfhydrogenase subunit gamma (sulfur reductase)
MHHPQSGSSPSPAKSLYVPLDCEIISTSELTPNEKLFRLRLAGGEPLGHLPGQFVQVSLLGWGEAPISVASSPTRGDGWFELGVRRAGSLTGEMHRLGPGDRIGIRGPFGSHFDVAGLAGLDLVLISGGCGLAPLRSLIQYCEDRREEFGRITILYGARSFTDTLFKDELAEWETSARFACSRTVDTIASGDRYDGNVGLITALVPPLETDPGRTVAVVVGPPVMYRPVIVELKKKGLSSDRIVVSLERQMRCGVGKCGHCTIEHLYCCQDGPVFSLDRVERLRGAL